MPTKKPLRALVLFDIDGTLLRRAGPHHRQALVSAVRHVTGLETTTEGIAVQGMLDPDILAEMMRNAGAKDIAIRRAMPQIIAAAQDLYEGDCPNLSRKLCPGARMLLYRLWRRGIPTGLVTGNLTRIGWMKMERAGLRRYFRFGAFAEMARTRSELARIAIRQARQEGWIERTSPVALIGDHFNDIAAAKDNGARSVAVATGVLDTEELAGYNPDLLLPDLRNVSLDQLFF